MENKDSQNFNFYPGIEFFDFRVLTRYYSDLRFQIDGHDNIRIYNSDGNLVVNGYLFFYDSEKLINKYNSFYCFGADFISEKEYFKIFQIPSNEIANVSLFKRDNDFNYIKINLEEYKEYIKKVSNIYDEIYILMESIDLLFKNITGEELLVCPVCDIKKKYDRLFRIQPNINEWNYKLFLILGYQLFEEHLKEDAIKKYAIKQLLLMKSNNFNVDRLFFSRTKNSNGVSVDFLQLSEEEINSKVMESITKEFKILLDVLFWNIQIYSSPKQFAFLQGKSFDLSDINSLIKVRKNIKQKWHTVRWLQRCASAHHSKQDDKYMVLVPEMFNKLSLREKATFFDNNLQEPILCYKFIESLSLILQFILYILIMHPDNKDKYMILETFYTDNFKKDFPYYRIIPDIIDCYGCRSPIFYNNLSSKLFSEKNREFKNLRARIITPQITLF